MSLRLSEESQLTKSAFNLSKSRADPSLQSWINKGGPGLSSQSQHVKSDKKLPPHPDFALKGTEPVKRIEDQISSGHLHELKARFNVSCKSLKPGIKPTNIGLNRLPIRIAAVL